MLDHINNLDLFLSNAEKALATNSDILLEEEVSREALLSLFAFQELVDGLPAMSLVDKEIVLAFLLNKYCIVEGYLDAFNALGTLQYVQPGNSSGPVHWDDVIGKPISVTDIDQQQLTAFILNTLPNVTIDHVDGGTPDEQFPVQVRRGSTDQWESENPILLPGEFGYEYEGTTLISLKIGLGLRWGDTPVLMSKFRPIVTTKGRNLDNPGGARNQTWNLLDQNAANKAIFEPYTPPVILITSPTSLPLQEVGTTYTSNQVYTIYIDGVSSIRVETASRKLYVDGVVQGLVDQTTETQYVVVNKSINTTKSADGMNTVLTVGIKRSDNSAMITATIGVQFNYRSGYFLWPREDNLMGKANDELTNIIKALGDNVTGVKYSTLDYNGGKGFGTVAFNTRSLGGGLYNLYVFNPVSRGIASIAPDAFKNSPVDKTTRTFTYNNAGTSTEYSLVKMTDALQGSYNGYIN